MATTTLSRDDHDALVRALQMGQAASPEERTRLHELQGERGWLDAARAAVYGCQCRALKLKPWQSPPVEIEPDAQVTDPPSYGHSFGEISLVRRMLALGISRFEPDPLGALVEQAESARRDERVGESQ